MSRKNKMFRLWQHHNPNGDHHSAFDFAWNKRKDEVDKYRKANIQAAILHGEQCIEIKMLKDELDESDNCQHEWVSSVDPDIIGANLTGEFCHICGTPK